jgi:hypothetical protein
MVMTGGSSYGNIYWQVGTSENIGPGSEFQGILLAAVSITVGSKAYVAGGLLLVYPSRSMLSLLSRWQAVQHRFQRRLQACHPLLEHPL